jgi:DNA gyrase/topoisomerase IV subunit B
LNIEEGYEGLRYNNIVFATDADVDGMHIRLLLMTFFLQFFPDLVKNGHVYILETPLFRVRNKQETIYCYDETAYKIDESEVDDFDNLVYWMFNNLESVHKYFSNIYLVNKKNSTINKYNDIVQLDTDLKYLRMMKK